MQLEDPFDFLQKLQRYVKLCLLTNRTSEISVFHTLMETVDKQKKIMQHSYCFIFQFINEGDPSAYRLISKLGPSFNEHSMIKKENFTNVTSRHSP